LSSSTRIGEPFDTLSPTLILISFTTPAFGDGISMVALSDSSVTSDCSLDTASPGFTRTSMTSTSLKSPMSGTRTWLMKRLREQNPGQTTFLRHPGPAGRSSSRREKKRGLSLI
jgi:hypothetical protein